MRQRAKSKITIKKKDQPVSKYQNCILNLTLKNQEIRMRHFNCMYASSTPNMEYMKSKN